MSYGSPSSIDTNLYISKPRRSSDIGTSIQWNWIAAIYFAAFVSTMTAKYCVNLEDGFDALERQSLLITAQRDHLWDDLNTLDGYIQEEQQKLRQLKKTRVALEHEVQVVAEYREETGRNQFLPRQTDDVVPVNDGDGGTKKANSASSKHSKTIQKWLSSRKENLVRRIHHLQAYLQRMSYAAVVRKFGGAGTYQVEFTVDMKLDTGKRSVETITIETVPLDDMPASVHLFLDTVRSGQVWDNAMFIRHAEDLDHVLPAAPVDYDTHNVRRTLLGSLGWVDLGFPEYNNKYPHAKYTVGFAGKGPTFYINTMDNSEDHGPGGQHHHLLPGDADPCFGRVVKGQQVVDALVKLGSIQTKMAKDSNHPWADEQHRSTRIVSARIASTPDVSRQQTQNIRVST
jgi:Cyclophilin type peptidyl-prolyl cis-trans isomerase/CLD